MYRSSGQSFVVFQVMLFLAFFFKDAGSAVGVADGGRLDLARSSLGGDGCRWRAQIQKLEGLGRGPGRWATTDDFFNVDGFFNFDSYQSLCAMGLLQLTVRLVFFFDGDGRRRGGRLRLVREESRGISVNFLFVRVLCEVWLAQLPLYPLRMYSYNLVYVFLT